MSDLGNGLVAALIAAVVVIIFFIVIMLYVRGDKTVAISSNPSVPTDPTVPPTNPSDPTVPTDISNPTMSPGPFTLDNTTEWIDVSGTFTTNVPAPNTTYSISGVSITVLTRPSGSAKIISFIATIGENSAKIDIPMAAIPSDGSIPSQTVNCFVQSSDGQYTKPLTDIISSAVVVFTGTLRRPGGFG